MPTLKVVAEYECLPLWVRRSGVFVNVDPLELGLEPELATDLRRWSSTYDATLKRDDPVSSGFQAVADQQHFVDEGRALARRVKSQLGRRYTVLYRPDDSTATEPIE